MNDIENNEVTESNEVIESNETNEEVVEYLSLESFESLSLADRLAWLEAMRVQVKMQIRKDSRESAKKVSRIAKLKAMLAALESE